MDLPLATIVLMYAASALLPLWGLRGLYVTATRDAKTYAAAPAGDDPDTPTWGQLSVQLKFLHDATKGRPRAVVRDFLVIGLGVCLGAAASVWALFLPA